MQADVVAVTALVNDGRGRGRGCRGRPKFASQMQESGVVGVCFLNNGVLFVVARDAGESQSGPLSC